jgi:hypothetical protein
MTVRNAAMIAVLLMLAGCARGQDATLPGNDDAAVNFSRDASDGNDDAMAGGDNVAEAPLPTDAWIGKWIGVEGLVLNIQKSDEKRHYVLSVTLLDGTKSYDGVIDGDVIRFTRDGRPESIRVATGDETGLKWLAGKPNCLMIKQGEGFCREP